MYPHSAITAMMSRNSKAANPAIPTSACVRVAIIHTVQIQLRSLRSEQPELCYSCHEKAKFAKKYVHSIIAAGGCTSCHVPHISNNPALLSYGSVNELCLTCHVAKADGRHIVALPGKRIHPIKGVDPSTQKMIKVPDPNRPGQEMEIPDPNVPGKEITCATCHEPHSSDFAKLFTQKNICARCHKYY